MGKFFQFGTVGVLGFLVDAATVYAAAPLLGLYGAGLLSYLVAATVTWFLNRNWTFRASRHDPAWRQWSLFMIANSVGFVLNRGMYIGLLIGVPACRDYPVLAVAAGSLTGLCANFALSRKVVF